MNKFTIVLIAVITVGCGRDQRQKQDVLVRSDLSDNKTSSEHAIFLKQCGIKLDACFKKCNQENPYSYFEKATREKCKDECANRLENKEGCYLYFRSSRDHEFRAYSTR